MDNNILNRRRYFLNTESNEVYFLGKDQKNSQNLINAKTHSEYFIPGFYDTQVIDKYFKPIPPLSNEWEVLEYSKDNFIDVGTVINGKSTSVKMNANIRKVKRLSDNVIFTADNSKYKTKHSTFYITGFWYNTSLKTISVCGNYRKNDNYFSCNIASLKDLLPKI